MKKIQIPLYVPQEMLNDLDDLVNKNNLITSRNAYILQLIHAEIMKQKKRDKK